MKRARQALFWLHLILGLAAGGILAITTFTGAAMAFEKQVIAWAEQDLRRVTPPAPGAERLSLDELLQRVRDAHPAARPQSLTVSADPGTVVMVSLGRTNIVYLDPYSGELRPQGAGEWRAFFQLMLRWHRWLGVHPSPSAEGQRPAGEGARPPSEGSPSSERAMTPRELASTVVGTSAILLFLLSVSGLYLWWPKAWTWRQFRARLALNPRLRGKARDWNWHHAVGLWTAPLLMVMSFTGAVIAFRGLGNAVYGPAPTAASGTNAPVFHAATPGDRPLAVEALVAMARREAPDWESITVRFGNGRARGGNGQAGEPAAARSRPEEVGASAATPSQPPAQQGRPAVSVLIRTASARTPVPLQVHLNPFTGEVVRREALGDGGVRRMLRQLNRTLHTGEAGGWLGQTLALLGCVGGLLLIYTGLALAWRRLIPRRRTSPVESTPHPTLEPAARLPVVVSTSELPKS